MAAPIDLATLEDDVLDAMRVAILTEQERRALCEQLPEQLADMARAAVTAGVPEDEVRSRVEGVLSAMPAAAPATTAEQETTA